MEHLDLVSLTPQERSKVFKKKTKGRIFEKNIFKPKQAKKKDRRNPFERFFSKDKGENEQKKPKTTIETDKENEEDMFDIVFSVQGSR